LTKHLSDIQASYTTESLLDAEKNTTPPTVDERIRHLEALLSEYAQINSDLERRIESLSGSLTSGESWKDLKQQVATLNSEKSILEQGESTFPLVNPRLTKSLCRT
jgi:DNA repair exonuclease SbcCD ATPase subunit